MSVVARLRSWFRAAFRRPGLNREIHDELEFHVACYAEDLRRRGVGAAEADRQARLALGGVDARREECRESLGLRLVDEWRGDVRYALRLLRRSPGFAVAVVLSLGLAIGANTAIFSLVDAVLLKPLPVERPDRLFFVDDTGGRSEGSNGPPYPCYEILRDRTRSFSGLAMFEEQRSRVTIDGVEERVRSQYASGNYFNVLGVGAALGRVLTAADDPPGGSGGPDGPVVVISHAFWTRRFHATPSAIGQRIKVGPTWMTIVGVTPAGFTGPTVGSPVDLTVPVTVTGVNLSRRESWWFSVIGRLPDDVRVEDARAELDALFQSYMGELGLAPDSELRRHFSRIELVPAARGLHEIRRELAAPLLIVMTIVGLVLVIGCANVANLLLARASAREHEMTLRLAIGAGRGRIVRQLLTEGTVIAGLGALAGLLIAHWSLNLLTGMIGEARQQIVIAAGLDSRVLLFATLVTTLTGVLCSLVPALRTTRDVCAKAAHAGRHSPDRRHRWIGRALVIVQVSLSLALLAAAALFIRTLGNLRHVDAGFQTAGVFSLPIEATIANPPPGSDAQPIKMGVGGQWASLAARSAQLPGVRSAAVSTLVPLSGRDRGVKLWAEGGEPFPDSEHGIRLNQVSARYFETLGLSFVAGRPFGDADAAQQWRVAILNETAARQHFRGASPIGRFVHFGGTKTNLYEVVGVVHDTKYESLRLDAGPVVYVPIQQPLDAIRSAFLSVRGSPGAGVPVAALREEIKRSLPGPFVGDAHSLDQAVASSLLQERIVSLLASLFGTLALTLSGVGLYGLIAFSVVRRTSEIGIRLAIGAQRWQVAGLVVREAVVLVGTALAVGLLAVLAAGRFVRVVLFGVAPWDPQAIGAAAAILLLTALVAAYVPARRASRTDLIHTLRRE